jgi:hypothetical protein
MEYIAPNQNKIKKLATATMLSHTHPYPAVVIHDEIQKKDVPEKSIKAFKIISTINQGNTETNGPLFPSFPK